MISTEEKSLNIFKAFKVLFSCQSCTLPSIKFESVETVVLRISEYLMGLKCLNKLKNRKNINVFKMLGVLVSCQSHNPPSIKFENVEAVVLRVSRYFTGQTFRQIKKLRKFSSFSKRSKFRSHVSLVLHRGFSLRVLRLQCCKPPSTSWVSNVSKS